MPIAIKRVTCREIRVNYLSGSPRRTESSCQMRSVSQNKICQGEHDIQFSDLGSEKINIDYITERF